MADYIPIDNSEIAPDAPITAGLGARWRDNPIAISEGAAGAPRIQDAAMSTTVTTAGRNWVANRYSSQASNGVGQVVMARYTSSGSGLTRNIGDGANGSELFPCSADGTIQGASLPGSWVCQGYAASGSTGASVTNWKRVA